MIAGRGQPHKSEAGPFAQPIENSGDSHVQSCPTARVPRLGPRRLLRRPCPAGHAPEAPPAGGSPVPGGRQAIRGGLDLLPAVPHRLVPDLLLVPAPARIPAGLERLQGRPARRPGGAPRTDEAAGGAGPEGAGAGVRILDRRGGGGVLPTGGRALAGAGEGRVRAGVGYATTSSMRSIRGPSVETGDSIAAAVAHFPPERMVTSSEASSMPRRAWV